MGQGHSREGVDAVSGIYCDLNGFLGNGAGSRIRTRDPEITNHVLYQLSYTGAGNGFYQIAHACPCPGELFCILIPEILLSLSLFSQNGLAAVDKRVSSREDFSRKALDWNCPTAWRPWLAGC